MTSGPLLEHRMEGQEGIRQAIIYYSAAKFSAQLRKTSDCILTQSQGSTQYRIINKTPEMI